MVQPDRSSTDLTHLCAAVAFERISFTAVVALLVLYLNERFGISAAHAALQLGGFVAATYLTPVAGGWLADRALGQRRACILGTMLVAIGGCGLMLDTLSGLYPALALIAIGQGLFKPNTQALLGGLYAQDEARRAAAFRTYYAAANIGAMLGPLLVEALRRRAGWGLGFTVVVLGATLAMMAMGLPVAGVDRAESAATRSPALGLPPISRRALRALGTLCTLAMLFCASNSQASGALLFWVRDSVNRQLLGYTVPTAYFAALPALLVIALVPLFSRLVVSCRLLQVAATKLTLGLLALALSYGLLVIPASRVSPHGAAMLWIVAAMALASTSEILVMATGMEAVSRAIPAARTGLGYGLWCAALAAGNVLGGLLGCLWGKQPAAFFGLLTSCALFGVLSLGLWSVRLRVIEPL